MLLLLRRPLLEGEVSFNEKASHEVLKDWEAVIGLEVHTELTTLRNKNVLRLQAFA